MLNKIKNIDPNTMLVVKTVAAQAVLLGTIVAVTVVSHKIKEAHKSAN